MYKLTRVPTLGGGTTPYGYENYELKEDSIVLYERVRIIKLSKENTIYGGLFQRDSKISTPTGEIAIYKYPPTNTQDSVYPIMTIPTNCTVIIEL